jgi:hypothetical protein
VRRRRAAYSPIARRASYPRTSKTRLSSGPTSKLEHSGRYATHMWVKLLRRSIGTVAGCVVAAIAVAALLYLPNWLVDLSAVGPTTAYERLQAISAQRQIVLWILGGIIAIITLSYTHIRHRLDRDSNRTDRYSSAIDQLGSEKLMVRIGGIFALERIAIDSARERGPVMNVLSAFVTNDRPRIFDSGIPPAYPIPLDVVAALQVIGRLPRSKPDVPPNLNSADLSGADLHGANLRNAVLSSADMMSANLTGAILKDADLGPADSRLVGASLYGATLDRADLSKANLTDAEFTDASVRRTKFHQAILTRTRLDNIRPKQGTKEGPIGLEN